ncbi:IPL1 [Symbiodinium microadriaticum]|nr:IPL1 [Symbiodinium microadriaticum]
MEIAARRGDWWRRQKRADQLFGLVGWRPRYRLKQLQNHKHKKFVVADKIVQGGKASYEWMSEDQVKKDRLLDFDNKSAAPKDDPMDLAMFRKTLVEHQIDPNVFGVAKAKGLDQLAKEVETGASRLMLDAQQHKKLASASNF